VEAGVQKGSFFWPLLRFNFRDNCPSGSENEFVDIDSFSDAAPEVRKDAVLDVAAATADVSLPIHSRDETSPKFTKELKLTIHRGEDLVQSAPLLEVREVVPEGQAPSPSLAAFNKSFGTSHRGELLSVGFKATSIGSGESKTLTLWKSPALVDETGGEGSEQTGEAVRDSGRGAHSALRKTSSSQSKTTSSSVKKFAMQNLSKQGSFLFITFRTFQTYESLLNILFTNFFRIQGSPSIISSGQVGAVSRRLFPQVFHAREGCR
jgi:hypothetical protein